MAFIVVGLVALILIGALIYVLGSANKRSEMTEEEFEAEVKRGSLLGAAFMGVEKALRAKEIEQVLVQKERVEKGYSISGDPPTTGEGDAAEKPK